MFFPHPAAYYRTFYAYAKYTKASEIYSWLFLYILSMDMLLKLVIFYTNCSKW